MSPGQVDAVVVRRHLPALDAAGQRLRRHAGRLLFALADDPDAQWAVERGLQLAAQSALDIATHLAASAGRTRLDYATAIDVLGEVGVLPTESARRFRGVAGFRNVLVHGPSASRTYMLSLRYECRFWDMAYARERWPSDAPLLA